MVAMVRATASISAPTKFSVTGSLLRTGWACSGRLASPRASRVPVSVRRSRWVVEPVRAGRSLQGVSGREAFMSVSLWGVVRRRASAHLEQ